MVILLATRHIRATEELLHRVRTELLDHPHIMHTVTQEDNLNQLDSQELLTLLRINRLPIHLTAFILEPQSLQEPAVCPITDMSLHMRVNPDNLFVLVLLRIEVHRPCPEDLSRPHRLPKLPINLHPIPLLKQVLMVLFESQVQKDHLNQVPNHL